MCRLLGPIDGDRDRGEEQVSPVAHVAQCGTPTPMSLRVLPLVGLAVLGLSAVACSSAASGPVAYESDILANEPASSSLSTAELQTKLAAALDGLAFTSESDYPFDVLVAPGVVGAAVDAAAVKNGFNDLTLAATRNEKERFQLKDMPGSEERDFEAWMDFSEVDTSDETSVAYAKGMTTAHDLMKANLTDLKVVLVASESLENSEDVGFLHCFIVGRAKDGALVALHTGLVWT